MADTPVTLTVNGKQASEAGVLTVGPGDIGTYGVAPLDATGKVPSANLPAGSGGSSSTVQKFGGFVDPTTTDGDLFVRKAGAVAAMSILFIGDSITSGQLVPTAPVGPCAAALTQGGVTVTGLNQGVPGSTTTGWLPGSTNMINALAAGLPAKSRIAHIMLGTNDSGGPLSQADYRANMVSICKTLIANGFIVVLSYPPYAADHVPAVSSYCAAIDSLVDNFHVFQGDTQAQAYFKANPSMMQSDNIHPTQAGSNILAGFWATAMQAVVNAITNFSTTQRLALSNELRIDYSGASPVLTTAQILRIPFSAVVANSKRRLAIPRGMTIEGWEILANVSGSLTLNISACAYADYPTATSICASAKPTLSAASKGKDSGLTGWTTVLADDSAIIVNVDSVTTITEFELSLRCVSKLGSTPPVSTVTWNPVDIGTGLTLSGGNLITTMGTADNFRAVRATLSRSAATAAHYFKVKFTSASSTQTTIGFADASAALTDFIGSDVHGWAAYGNDGGGIHSGAHSAYGSPFGGSVDDEILVVLKGGSMFWRRNGVWQGSGNPSTGANPCFTSMTGNLFPALAALNSGQTAIADFSTVDTDTLLAGCSPWAAS